MTIQEAIKSGKKFKRPFEENWWSIHQDRDGMKWAVYGKDQKMEALSMDWIISDDWEIEEEKIQITKSQLMKIIADTLRKDELTKMGTILSILTPHGPDQLSSEYGLRLLMENYRDFLKELGFND